MSTKSNWNPEYKYETLTGKFTDYRGQERDFTMVAVSVPATEERHSVVKTVAGYPGYWEGVADVAKMLTIGVAVRCVRDKDLGLGERIAYGKALALRNHTVYVSHPGMINTKMVKALLEQEAAFFKKDPGSYIKGYNFDRDRYRRTGKIAEAEMTEAEINQRNFDNKIQNETIEPATDRTLDPRTIVFD